MEVRCSITQRFIVQLSRVEHVPQCSGNFGHFGEVGVPCNSIKLMQLVKARFGKKKARSLEVLVGIEPDVSRGQPCNRPYLFAQILSSIVRTDVAETHARKDN
jgi:hypothetical protein